jgi:hypothetical protein
VGSQRLTASAMARPSLKGSTAFTHIGISEFIIIFWCPVNNNILPPKMSAFSQGPPNAKLRFLSRTLLTVLSFCNSRRWSAWMKPRGWYLQAI